MISVQNYDFGYINVPFGSNKKGYFGTDLVIFNRGQMTRTTPELETRFPNFRTTLAGGRLPPPIYDLTCNRPTYTAESGFKLGTLRLEAETLLLVHCGIQNYEARPKMPQNRPRIASYLEAIMKSFLV
ncbi:hypothetical protein AVEN_230931-1 [Araneus ventricosus]|uniref:Uncharacterized protein n=1 Tax=Araneus ventricosus TaxID=182803 RepID=A0A4Y2A4Z2_ARAVE|nr:hypothetical protein AVEN_230931-1 [Araneus ventricosus]